MSKVQDSQVPDGALLATYRRSGAYTSSFFADVPRPVSHEAYTQAFFTSGLFKFERSILGLLVNRPSTDAQAEGLARGELQAFAAWTVEARAERELLMNDFMGRTRLWLMSSALPDGGTRLHFGSAYVPRVHRRTGQPHFGWPFHALKGLHVAYSRALLRAAVSTRPVAASGA